jgi:hypothetical protein
MSYFSLLQKEMTTGEKPSEKDYAQAAALGSTARPHTQNKTQNPRPWLQSFNAAPRVTTSLCSGKSFLDLQTSVRKKVYDLADTGRQINSTLFVIISGGVVVAKVPLLNTCKQVRVEAASIFLDPAATTLLGHMVSSELSCWTLTSVTCNGSWKSCTVKMSIVKRSPRRTYYESSSSPRPAVRLTEVL